MSANANSTGTKRSVSTSLGKTHRQAMYTSYMDDLEKQKKDEIKEVFDLFDTEQKGFIVGSNMKICLKTLGIEIKKKELAPILEEMFSKGINDTYKFDQFYQVTKRKMDEKDPDEEMKKEFYLLCDYKDNSNNNDSSNKEENESNKADLKLTRDSLIELADKVGETLSKEEIDEMVTIVGGNKGCITEEDFVAFMRNPLQYNAKN